MRSTIMYWMAGAALLAVVGAAQAADAADVRKDDLPGPGSTVTVSQTIPDAPATPEAPQVTPPPAPSADPGTADAPARTPEAPSRPKVKDREVACSAAASGTGFAAVCRISSVGDDVVGPSPEPGTGVTDGGGRTTGSSPDGTTSRAVAGTGRGTTAGNGVSRTFGRIVQAAFTPAGDAMAAPQVTGAAPFDPVSGRGPQSSGGPVGWIAGIGIAVVAAALATAKWGLRLL